MTEIGQEGNMKVALYARVSTERQADRDLSIPAQLKALKNYAVGHGWEVVAEYVDEAESARTANRPQFKEMVATARRKGKPFSAILVWKLSRFARNREDSIVYKSLLRKQGVQVISINERVDDSPAGKLLEGMIEVVDEFYSTNLAEDVLRGMAANAEKGFFNGGTVPFGYRRVRFNSGNAQKSRLEPKEDEALTVSRIFQMAIAGQGVKEIAKTLNKDRIRTRTGKLWSKTTIYKILKNEVHVGTLVWTGKDGTPIRSCNNHTALVSEEDFNKVQRLLTDRQPKVTHPRTVSSQYLLSPLLRCAACDAPMIGTSAKSGQFSYYRCSNALRHSPESCQSGWLPKRKIEDFVIDRLKQKVLTDENLSTLVKMINKEIKLLASHRHERIEEIDKQLDSVNRKLLRYYTAFENETMSDEDAAPRIKELRDEQTSLQTTKEGTLTDLQDTEPKELNTKQVLEYVEDIKSLLSKGTLMEQKTFLRSFVKRIDFKPGQVAVSYTIPMLMEKGTTSEREVLPIEYTGEPPGFRTLNLLIKSQLLYR